MNRQIGIVLDRNNISQYIVVGTNKDITIPKLSRFGLTPGRLRGLRVVHTHLYDENISEDDITDLALLRLDSISAVQVDDNGYPKKIMTAHLLPQNKRKMLYKIIDFYDPYNQIIKYLDFINELEKEFVNIADKTLNIHQKNSAILVGVYKNKLSSETNIEELEELSKSANIAVINRFSQIRDKIHPKYVIGLGKLKEVVVYALQAGADFLLFDNTLTPAQARTLANFTEMKIIDRTQLILDIFAKRAKSNEGKLRVELAQLNHILPRLSVRDDSLSRLTGGIGGRGPGETKLEVDKRRINDRVFFLTHKLESIKKNRNTQKKKRSKNNIPIVSIVGYTNAGKSTLLNNLTQTETYCDDLMFATLDPVSKRVRFPEEREVIITDTVGFIRDLPEDLKGAFKSTLEELYDSDLLLHLVDASNHFFNNHIKSANTILDELKLSEKPEILVFNKIDTLEEKTLSDIRKNYPVAMFISALNKRTFKELLQKIEYKLFLEGKKTHIELQHYPHWL